MVPVSPPLPPSSLTPSSFLTHFFLLPPPFSGLFPPHSPSVASLAAGAVDRARLALASGLTGTPTDSTHKDQGLGSSGSLRKRDFRSPVANMTLSSLLPSPVVAVAPVVVAAAGLMTAAAVSSSSSSSSSDTPSPVPSPVPLSASVERGNEDEEESDSSRSPDLALALGHTKDHTNLSCDHEVNHLLPLDLAPSLG